MKNCVTRENSPERMEIENLERDKMLGFNTKFQNITQEKGFVKIQESLDKNDKFNHIDFSFMGYYKNFKLA